MGACLARFQGVPPRCRGFPVRFVAVRYGWKSSLSYHTLCLQLLLPAERGNRRKSLPLRATDPFQRQSDGCLVPVQYRFDNRRRSRQVRLGKRLRSTRATLSLLETMQHPEYLGNTGLLSSHSLHYRGRSRGQNALVPPL